MYLPVDRPILQTTVIYYNRAPNLTKTPLVSPHPRKIYLSARHRNSLRIRFFPKPRSGPFAQSVEFPCENSLIFTQSNETVIIRKTVGLIRPRFCRRYDQYDSSSQSGLSSDEQAVLPFKNALHTAIDYGSVDVVRALLENGIDPNAGGHVWPALNDRRNSSSTNASVLTGGQRDVTPDGTCAAGK